MPNPSKELNLQPARRLIERHLAHSEPYQVVIDSLRLTILPGVFCPAYTKTSSFLARHVRVGAGETVLDMFSGSGYQGLLAARRAAKVVCVDRSEAAGRCTEINAAANGLADRVSVRVGDLFEPVPERYDVVIANPPLLPGVPTNLLEAAIFDTDLGHSKRFVAQVGDHLTDCGRAFLVATDAHQALQTFDVEACGAAAGLRVTTVGRRVLPYETYTVFQLEPARRR